MGRCGWWWLVVVILSLTMLPMEAFERRRVRVGVDYGPRLIGIATADVGSRIHPHSTIINTHDLVAVSKTILAIAQSITAKEIILGIPLDIDGQADYYVANFNGRMCLNFSRVLSSVAQHGDKSNGFRCPPSVQLFDERYTTREAHFRRTQKDFFGSMDAVSAACLLERYLEDEGKGSFPAQPCEFPPPIHLATLDYQLVRAHVRKQHNPPPQFKGDQLSILNPTHATIDTNIDNFGLKQRKSV
jgi:RNase H-fold protein (predicted Holliday junction resolvase)